MSVDLKCRIDPNAQILMQIARHIVFGAVSTERLTEYNTNISSDRCLTRNALALHLCTIITWHNHSCVPNKSDLMRGVLHIFGTTFSKIVAAVNKYRAMLSKLVSGFSEFARPHVYIWLRQIPVNPRDFAAVRQEHLMHNKFLTRYFEHSQPCAPHLELAGRKAPTKPSVGAKFNTASKNKRLSGASKIPLVKTPSGAKKPLSSHCAANALSKEVIEIYKAANVSPVVINLQIHGFLNPKALPRPTITPARAALWQIQFIGVQHEHAGNLMSAILCAVAVQFNIFVHAQGHNANARIGHISKVFKNYTAAHYLAIELFMKRNNVSNCESVHLRYNQLIANFRKYLRLKFCSPAYMVIPQPKQLVPSEKKPISKPKSKSKSKSNKRKRMLPITMV